jgi:hypothetical protein
MAKKAARTKLRDEIKRFYDIRLTSPHYHRPEPDTRSEWLLERVKATATVTGSRPPNQWTACIFECSETSLEAYPSIGSGTIEMQDFLREWLQELGREGYSNFYIEHTLI